MTAVSLAVTIVAMIATLGTTVTLGMIATAMTVIRKTATGTTAVIVGNAPDRLLAAMKSMIVAPGRLPLRGNMMIGGLQGTMIDEDRMMFGEALTLILTVAGMNVGVKKRTTASRREHRGRPMETTVGRAE